MIWVMANMDYFFDSCDYDIMVFDENRSNREVISFENNLVTLHHASLSETNTNKLLSPWADLTNEISI